MELPIIMPIAEQQAMPVETLPKQTMPNPNVTDYGPNPFVTVVGDVAMCNETFRTALWTGNHLQVTVMNIKPGDDVGLEVHPTTDQYITVAEGCGVTRMASSKDGQYTQTPIFKGSGVFIPAGTWHNLVNTSNCDLKLISVYAPPEHPYGTIHKTKRDAEEC